MIGNSSYWSRLDDKLFEQALVVFPEGTPDRWAKIARQVPGKTCAQVSRHYEDLVHDVGEIDSGRVELPSYEDEYLGTGDGSKMTERETERRKGIPWTEEEHRLFLIGLQRYGKGDWRSISRNAVVSRTPTQVASHAQKYFLRLNSMKKDKKRSSIHDITSSTIPANDLLQVQPNDPNWIEPLSPPKQVHPHGSPSAYHGFRFPL